MNTEKPPGKSLLSHPSSDGNCDGRSPVEFKSHDQVFGTNGTEATSTQETSTHSNSQHRFVIEHSTCAMCDTPLEIGHEINSFELKVKEEAHCPSCGIRVRVAHHFMH